ncbi:MAG: hypothetical protein Q7K26_00610 [bacterium]|nr:hypothetical protein [bacterium]
MHFWSADTEFWYAHVNNESGLQTHCKACSHEASYCNTRESKTGRAEKSKIIDLIERYSSEGKSLVELANNTGFKYESIRYVTRLIGHTHPKGIDQLELRYRFEQQIELEEYVRELALTGHGLYRAAEVIGTDKTSLEQFAKDRKIRFDPTLIKSAIRCAAQGLTLHDLATQKNLNYSSVKMRLTRCGYKHPYGIELTKNRILWKSGLVFDVELMKMIADGKSRNEIAIHFRIDNATLQKYANAKQITFNVVKPIPKNFDNIIRAIKKRQKKRKDLVWIKHNNERLYLEQWSKRTGIQRATIQKRLNLGFSTDEALTAPINSRRGFSSLNALTKLKEIEN